MKAKGLPRGEWTTDEIFRDYKFTNVKRVHDYTTSIVYKLNSQIRRSWRSVAPGSKGVAGEKLKIVDGSPWTAQQEHIAELIVLNTALWRMFGTPEMALRIGWVNEWTPKVQQQVIDAAKSLWDQGVHAYTDAYQPQSIMRNCEIRATNEAQVPPPIVTEKGHVAAANGEKGSPKTKTSIRTPVKAAPETPLEGDVCSPFQAASKPQLYGVERVLNVYWKSVHRVTGVWEARDEILAAIRTRSWKETCAALSKVKWFGGSGFQAKEVVQDWLHTVLFEEYDSNSKKWISVCKDDALWSPIGPGARRGLNRLGNRPTNSGLVANSLPSEAEFLKEMIEIYEARGTHWPKEIAGEPSVTIDELHDIQFQLCEFDKYQRILNREGKSRKYTPRPSSVDGKAPDAGALKKALKTVALAPSFWAALE